MFMATLKRPYANHILFPTCSETTGQVSIVIYQKQKKKSLICHTLGFGLLMAKVHSYSVNHL